MTLAIPSTEGRLHEHFGGCTQFTLVQTNPAQRKILGIQTLTAPPHAPGSFPRWLREQGVQALIAAGNGIGQRALDNLVCHGIEVLTGRPGAPVEALVAACLEGQLPQMREGCDNQQEPVAKAHACALAAYFERPTDGD
jgi:predicted Fe-Mo cluster-binding NifX family protein